MRPILFLIAALFCSCEAPPAVVGPKPNVAPVITSNQATRQSIGDTRRSIGATRLRIKESQASAAAGGKHLDTAESDLDALLKATPTPAPK